MLNAAFQALLRGARRRQARQTGSRRTPRFTPALCSLEQRDVPAILAEFGGGSLAVVGDDFNNTITISRDVAGQIFVNGGEVTILGDVPTVANVTRIKVFGRGGNDVITLDETNGVLPAAALFGGSGNDTLIGGSGNDLLFGEAGNDILIGGRGDDFVFGGAGDDQMIWNPGDGTDLNEGGAGTDTVIVNGGNGAEQFTVNPNGNRVRFDRVSPAPFSIDIGTSENLVVNMNGGDDIFQAANGLASLIKLTVDGGAGNDTIIGGDGDDLLLGGDGDDLILGGAGNDTIIGGRGTDVALMGNGNDVFVWNPGDGSDQVFGDAGRDELIFNGANVAENFDLFAQGSAAILFRNVGNITMEMHDTEVITFNALGGADNVTVNDLTSTAVTDVNVNLAAAPGGTAGDNTADTVTVLGTGGDDIMLVTGNASEVQVLGLPARVRITGFDPGLDRLILRGGNGHDVIEASGMAANSMLLTLDGGDGDDVLIGGAGDDVLIGGPGDDVLVGGPGVDTLDGGPGNNVLIP